MKRGFVLLFIIIISFSHIFAQANVKKNIEIKKIIIKTEVPKTTELHINGIQIGNQVWMTENVNIPNKGSCFYKYDKNIGYKFGKLYTWEAAKKACPIGWHLPSINEWNQLFDNIGGEDKAGKRLKEKGDTGFDAVLGGMSTPRDFQLINNFGGYWTSTGFGERHAWYILFTKEGNGIATTYFSVDYGFSVRCVKD